MKRILVNVLNNYINENICIQGWIYKVRKLKSITFLILRDRSGMVQCVLDNNKFNIAKLTNESVISINGIVKDSKNVLNPFEIEVEKLEIISKVYEELPIEINKENLEVNLDTMLNNRVLSLRHKKVASIFKVHNIIVNAFREFLNSNGFTEINTPKIVKDGQKVEQKYLK